MLELFFPPRLLGVCWLDAFLRRIFILSVSLLFLFHDRRILAVGSVLFEAASEATALGRLAVGLVGKWGGFGDGSQGLALGFFGGGGLVNRVMRGVGEDDIADVWS